MKRLVIIAAVALALGAVFWMSLAKDGAVSQEDELRVTCTTSLLSSIVEAVAGDRADVHTIVPFGMCPGHFDITPGEADRLRDADILLHHGYESFLNGLEPSAKTRMIAVEVEGNWMIPPLYTEAVDRVAAVLTEASPESADLFAERAESYKRAVTEHAERSSESLAGVEDLPVVCAEMNRDLAEWFGFRVVAAFARDEDVSVKSLHDILARAKASEAALVIDNMQSSGKIGRTIAEELGVPFLMLSNFPDEELQTGSDPSYLTAQSENTGAILEAFHSRGKGNQSIHAAGTRVR